MNLILKPEGIPGVWAATVDGKVAVKRSPHPNNLGLWAYFVRREMKDGSTHSYIIRERWINDFLTRLCVVADIHSINLCKHEADKNPLWRGYRPRVRTYKQKPYRGRPKAVTDETIAWVMEHYHRLEGPKVARCREIARMMDKGESTVRRYVDHELKQRRAA